MPIPCQSETTKTKNGLSMSINLGGAIRNQLISNTKSRALPFHTEKALLSFILKFVFNFQMCIFRRLPKWISQVDNNSNENPCKSFWNWFPKTYLHGRKCCCWFLLVTNERVYTFFLSDTKRCRKYSLGDQMYSIGSLHMHVNIQHSTTRYTNAYMHSTHVTNLFD